MQNTANRLRGKDHRNGKKTHCPQGHEYNKENTIVARRGIGYVRMCRLCQNEGQNRRYHARKLTKLFVGFDFETEKEDE